MKAKIYVTLKQEVLDPQGEAIGRALGSLGFEGIKSVRVGKLIEIEGDQLDKDSVDAMCKKLLSNAVIEDYRSELVDPDFTG